MTEQLTLMREGSLLVRRPYAGRLKHVVRPTVVMSRLFDDETAYIREESLSVW